MFGYWDLILIPIGLVLLGYVYSIWDDGYFKRRGVKSLPSYPLVGNMLRVLLQKEHFRDVLTHSYKAFPEEKYVGVRQFTIPLVMIKDLDILKQVTIKDFDYFQDHMAIVDDTVDPIFGNSLISMKGQKWRDMRATLSPAFTSSKIKNMFEFVTECGEQMANYFQSELQKPENEGKEFLEVEMKDAFTRYTNDVIATSAFGIKVDSLKDKDNEFYMMGKEVTNFTGAVKMMRFFCITSFPKLSKLLNLKLLTKKTSAFFNRIVLGSMKTRIEQHIERTDMIQLLMQARQGVLKHDHLTDNDMGFATVQESDLGKETVKRVWSDDEVVAQAMIFFLAGFDTSSTLLSFMAYELVAYPDIQKRLQEEIDQVLADTNGKVDYTHLNTMKYMDMVVSETLRYWPPAIAMDRKCVKPYTLPPSSKSSKAYELKVGDGIWIPVSDLHHDPQYYKDPHIFDPERFSDENKASIKPFSYMPFGVGPRNCIGSRFALMESKAVMFHLLAKFDFIKASKTQIPIKLQTNSFALQPENGFWIGFKPRQL